MKSLNIKNKNQLTARQNKESNNINKTIEIGNADTAKKKTVKRNEIFMLNGHSNNKQYERNLIECSKYNHNSFTINSLAISRQPSISNISRPQVVETVCINDTFAKFKELSMKNFKKLSILNFNAQGLLDASHFEQICVFVEKNNIDIISIEETWLNSSINDKLIAISGYKLYRSDRNLKRAKKKKGGGVCCYIRDNFKIIRAEKSSKSKYSLIDYLIIEIQSDRAKFLFCNFYRHHENPDSDTNEIFEHVVSLSLEYENVFICGDFNANYFEKTKYVKLQILSDSLVRINDDCPTYCAGKFAPSQLDLIFVKNQNSLIQFGHFPSLGVSNHHAIYAFFNLAVNKKKKREITMRNFTKYDEEGVKTFAQNIDWEQIERTESVDDKVRILCDILKKFTDDTFPEKKIISRNNPVPWMNEKIKKMMHERKIFYDWQKMNRKHKSHEIIYASYRKRDNQIKQMIKLSKKNCFEDKYKSAHDSREKWKIIHGFGITKKSKKQFETIINDRINPNSLNCEFNKTEALPMN